MKKHPGLIVLKERGEQERIRVDEGRTDEGAEKQEGTGVGDPKHVHEAGVGVVDVVEGFGVRGGRGAAPG
jgi:hypothetical protein